MVGITVITPTKRYGGIDIAVDCLSRQTIKDFEWVLVDEHWDARKDEVKRFVNERLSGINVVHTPPKMVRPTRKYNLCNSLNTGLLRSHGELIVWLQDFIWLPPSALERYWNAYDMFPNYLIGGIKDHYSGPPILNKEGKITIWENCWAGDPAEKCVLTARDDRYKSLKIEPGAEIVQSTPMVYEMCNASMPFTLAVALNGVDENYDNGRAYDNQNVSFRAKGLGYETALDMNIIAREFNHWEYFGNSDKISLPSVDNKPHPDSNYELNHTTMVAIQEGKYPLRAPNDFSLEAR